MQTIMARRPVLEFGSDVREHVEFGRIAPREESDWEISGAHNSHNFLNIAAESVHAYPRSLFQLCGYKPLPYYQGRENEAFQLEYKMKHGGKMWVKSLYNPRCFPEDRLFRLAKRALDNWQRHPLTNVEGNDRWHGSAVEDGKRYYFKGRYRRGEGNTYIVTTYHLSGIPRNGRWRR